VNSTVRSLSPNLSRSVDASGYQATVARSLVSHIYFKNEMVVACRESSLGILHIPTNRWKPANGTVAIFRPIRALNVYNKSTR
jgi:hypothetical protein